MSDLNAVTEATRPRSCANCEADRMTLKHLGYFHWGCPSCGHRHKPGGSVVATSSLTNQEGEHLQWQKGRLTTLAKKREPRQAPV